MHIDGYTGATITSSIPHNNVINSCMTLNYRSPIAFGPTGSIKVELIGSGDNGITVNYTNLFAMSNLS
jgi:hypothetical protein